MNQAIKPLCKPSTTLATEPFPLLADLNRYRACSWDLSQEDQYREYWLTMFGDHFKTLLDEAILEAVDRGISEQVIRRRTVASYRGLLTILEDYRRHPLGRGDWSVLSLCLFREQILRSQGITNPYRLVKQRANQAALGLLPSLLAELDQTPQEALPELITQGMFAGNIFDVGAIELLNMFEGGRTVDFHAVRSQLKPRPWLVDGLEAWKQRLKGKPHKSAVLFLDNAGCDVILGMIPFARYLLSRGTKVILAANQTPSLNDMTAEDLRPVLNQIATMDQLIAQSLESGDLEVVSSGNGAPLIDLRWVSPALAQAVKRSEVDLVVLEGMGRSIESNFNAQFTCEAIKVAMIKDPGVAESMNGAMYDLVFRYDGKR